MLKCQIQQLINYGESCDNNLKVLVAQHLYKEVH